MQNRFAFFVSIFCSFALLSCDGDRVFDEYRSVGDSWEQNEAFIFKFQQPDSINRYNLFVNVRNNNDYAYSNLFLIVKMNFPDGNVVTDTLGYEMAAPDGKWLGTGFTNTKESKLWYKENVRFPAMGTYEVSIEQAMRKINEADGIQKLKGISEVGFRIEKH